MKKEIGIAILLFLFNFVDAMFGADELITRPIRSILFFLANFLIVLFFVSKIPACLRVASVICLISSGILLIARYLNDGIFLPFLLSVSFLLALSAFSMKPKKEQTTSDSLVCNDA